MGELNILSGGDAFTFYRVLDFKESYQIPIAVKSVRGRVEPTTDIDVYRDEPRTYTLSCRLSDTEKDTLYTFESFTTDWDFQDDITLISKIWIEKIDFRYEVTESYDYPWLATLYMVETARTSSFVPMASCLFNLREHKYYAASNVDIAWSKHTATELRMYSTVASRGRGYMFVVVPRTWLNGKWVRYTIAYAGNPSIFIMDGSYDRTSDTDFPDGSDMLTKGVGSLQTLPKYDILGPPFYPVDVQINVSAGSETHCTIFFSFTDNEAGGDWTFDHDWFEINESALGVDNLVSEHFTDSVHMEQTGTQKDYGYISAGIITI